jgi:hypothetical protein
MGGEKRGNLRWEALTVQKGFGIIQKSSKQEFIGRDMKRGRGRQPWLLHCNIERSGF